MKKLFFAIALVISYSLCAQAKQDRVMLQQIVLLKTYGGYLKKGYTIAKDGLSFIGRMKSGELSLHTLFFDGLQLVNPKLRDYENVYTTIRLGTQILEVKANVEHYLADDLFYANEKEYIRRVFKRVAEQAESDLETLYDVITDNAIVADDAQRIERIDALKAEMEARYIFTRSFADEALGLIAARKREQTEVKGSRQLYNLNTAP
jgi:hypothetical protein